MHCFFTSHVGIAQAVGAASVVELLAMATAMLGSSSAASASAHADMTFRFLLPALDARQTQLAQFGATGAGHSTFVDRGLFGIPMLQS